MIQKVEMYQAVCDGCGKHEEQMFEKKSKALHVSLRQDWMLMDGKLYCPDCVEWDRGTKSYKPKKKE